jgi:hypothetical protein
MTTDIWRDFDPNLDLPVGLKNVNVSPTVQEGVVVDAPDEENVDEFELLEDDDSNEDFSNDILDPPSSMEIVSQTVRTAPDGRQVVDIIIDVEDIDGALNYELRVTTT